MTPSTTRCATAQRVAAARFDMPILVQMFWMWVLGGPCRDEQLGSDLSGRAACGDEAEHVDLAHAQPARTGAARSRSVSAAGSVDLPAGVDGGGVEVETCAQRDQFALFGHAESGGELIPELGQLGDMVEA